MIKLECPQCDAEGTKYEDHNGAYFQCTECSYEENWYEYCFGDLLHACRETVEIFGNRPVLNEEEESLLLTVQTAILKTEAR